MKCPQCGNLKAEELSDEVDIGVGVLKTVYGYDCPDCGQISVASCCGVIGDQPHYSWCQRFTQEYTNNQE